MKYKPCLLILFLLPLASFGQAGMWTWMNGDTTIGSSGHYGTKGVPDPANTPRGFYEACEWTDLQGNFWLFGGQDINGDSWGDLWEYKVASNKWTWVKGTGKANAAGIYGTMGVPDTNNRPPETSLGAETWTDAAGDLWMYGGRGSTAFNDLWRYNIASNTWTWMNGSGGVSTPAVYGKKGVPSPSNTPGRRYESSATWVDSNNDLWLFGGYCYIGSCTDLWRYNIASNEWTWMSGPTTTNSVGVFGTMGVADTSNFPASRFAYCTWKSRDNKFWLMGGTQFLSYTYNDMWMYDPVTNEWTWMSGSNQPGNNGSYGALCSSSVNYTPMARYENRARWTDDCGNFWMYGGDSYNNKPLSDLWSFNPATLKWTLINGSSALVVKPSYNKKGIASAYNHPGGRLGSLAWRSTTGDLYLFGGSADSVGSGLRPLNDMWKFIVDTSCSGPGVKPVINLGNDTTYCNSINRVLFTGYANTLWSTGTTAAQITINQPGTYWANLASGCGTSGDTIHISLLNSPPPINLGHDTTYCSSFSRILSSNNSNTLWSTGATASQITVTNAGTYWAKISNSCGVSVDTINIYNQTVTGSIKKKDDTLIAVGTGTVQWVNCEEKTPVVGATGNVFVPKSNGAYAAVITNGPCKDTTSCLTILNAGTESVNAYNSISIYPNPTTESINITLLQPCNKCLLDITDVIGREVLSEFLNGKENSIDITNLSKGIYIITINTNNETMVTKFVKQ